MSLHRVAVFLQRARVTISHDYFDYGYDRYWILPASNHRLPIDFRRANVVREFHRDFFHKSLTSEDSRWHKGKHLDLVS